MGEIKVEEDDCLCCLSPSRPPGMGKERERRTLPSEPAEHVSFPVRNNMVAKAAAISPRWSVMEPAYMQ